MPNLVGEQAAALDAALETAGVWERHERADAVAGEVPDGALRGIEVRTMGRRIADDPAFFLAAYAAGEIAASRLES